jgi:preprotein translocase subunit SecY
MVGSGFQNIFKIPELKKRIFYTLALLVVYRIGVNVPVPGIDSAALAEIFNRFKGVLGIVDLFSGGALERFSIFALGIMPYISSSIILQLLTVVVPHWSACPRKASRGARKLPSTPGTERFF